MPADIRAPLENEAATLAEAFSAIVNSSFPEFPPLAIASYLEPWREEILRERIRRGREVLLANYRNGRIAGIVAGTAPEGGVGTIIWLLVDAKWRGQGAGAELFAAACDHYRRIGTHKVKLTAPTEAARQFYERCGMKTEGFHPAHWWGADFWSLGMAL